MFRWEGLCSFFFSFSQHQIVNVVISTWTQRPAPAAVTWRKPWAGSCWEPWVSTSLPGWKPLTSWLVRKHARIFWRRSPLSSSLPSQFGPREITGRIHSSALQQKIRLNIYWAWPWLSEEDPVSPCQSLPTRSFHKPLILFHHSTDRLKTKITRN